MTKDKDILEKIKSIAFEIGQLTYCSDCPNDACIQELKDKLNFLLHEHGNQKKQLA